MEMTGQDEEGTTMLHTHFLQSTISWHERELDRSARAAFEHRGPDRSEAVSETVSLRLCCVGDDHELDRLSQLEGRDAPSGRHVVAEVAGVVVAALPLEGGEMLADPFRPTAHLLPLLELRAKQLRSDGPRRAFWSAIHLPSIGRAA
jgi:hypothetical protein